MEQIKENEEFGVRDLREKDQYKIDDKFLNGYAKFVSIYGVGVYNSLARHAEFKKQRAFPSAKKIAEELNISTPKVFYSLWVLQFFYIIRKKRVGKQCTNRYYLLHKKHWKSIEKTLLELESDVNRVNNSDINDINIRYKRHLHHLLTTLTSNSKDNKSKDNKKERTGFDKQTASLKRKEIKFNSDDYKKVISAYEELKGIKFQGREYEPVQQEIKTMFLSGRKPEDIIRCIRFMAKDEFYKNVFTIKTVRIKIAEFLAGVLEKKEDVPIYKNWVMPK